MSEKEPEKGRAARVFEVMDIIRTFDPFEQKIFLLQAQRLFHPEENARQMPFISWPSEWEVMIYPCSSCVLKGRIRLKSNPKREVSFYYDGNDVLGSITHFSLTPLGYWEIYYVGEEEVDESMNFPERYYISDIDGLMQGIRAMLEAPSK